MKLPKDHENWNSFHAKKAIALAEKEFEVFEKRVDLDDPVSVKLWWEPYARAKETAIEVSRVVGLSLWKEALRLP